MLSVVSLSDLLRDGSAANDATLRATYNMFVFVLTIYLRQAEVVWDDLCCDLTPSLSKLLDVSDNTFLRTGWVHFRVQHQMAFIFNGQVERLMKKLWCNVTL